MIKRTTPDTFGLHPHKIIVYILIAVIGVLFLGLSLAYVYTRVQHQVPAIKMPPIFIFNTSLLVGASICLHFAKKYFETDETNRYKHSLLLTIILTVFFLVGQIYGWNRLLQQEITINYHNGASYLYLISGVHLVHVLIGLPFLIIFYLKAIQRTQGAVSTLLYFADSDKKLMLKLMALYWHFIDILWIYLVTFFVANYFL